MKVQCDNDFGYINKYELLVPCLNALSQPPVSPLSKSQTGGGLHLWGDATVHGFVGAVVAGASITGLCGES
jgi:hypothetical protein